MWHQLLIEAAASSRHPPHPAPSSCKHLHNNLVEAAASKLDDIQPQPATSSRIQLQSAAPSTWSKQRPQTLIKAAASSRTQKRPAEKGCAETWSELGQRSLTEAAASRRPQPHPAACSCDQLRQSWPKLRRRSWIEAAAPSRIRPHPAASHCKRLRQILWGAAALKLGRGCGSRRIQSPRCGGTDRIRAMVAQNHIHAVAALIASAPWQHRSNPRRGGTDRTHGMAAQIQSMLWRQ